MPSVKNLIRLYSADPYSKKNVCNSMGYRRTEPLSERGKIKREAVTVSLFIFPYDCLKLIEDGTQ